MKASAVSRERGLWMVFSSLLFLHSRGRGDGAGLGGGEHEMDC